jgi:hypothetical protein
MSKQKNTERKGKGIYEQRRKEKAKSKALRDARKRKQETIARTVADNEALAIYWTITQE